MEKLEILELPGEHDKKKKRMDEEEQKEDEEDEDLLNSFPAMIMNCILEVQILR
jgi:hypothetical protein